MEGKIITANLFEILKEYDGNATIFINNKKVSKLFADKKYYYNIMKEQLSKVKIEIKVCDDIKVDEITIIYGDNTQKLSI